jgi:hypothetical protein
MSRHFRALLISLVVASSMSGAAVAGPRDNGDPEIPTSPHRLRPKDTAVGTVGSEMRSVQVAASATASERSDLWMRFLRTYLRLVRIVGP